MYFQVSPTRNRPPLSPIISNDDSIDATDGQRFSFEESYISQRQKDDSSSVSFASSYETSILKGDSHIEYEDNSAADGIDHVDAADIHSFQAHTLSRSTPYPLSVVHRYDVPDKLVSWDVSFIHSRISF